MQCTVIIQCCTLHTALDSNKTFNITLLEYVFLMQELKEKKIKYNEYKTLYPYSIQFIQ